MYSIQILKRIDESKDEIVRTTRELIQIPSENKPPHGYEKECQEYIARKFREVGMDADIFLPTDVEDLIGHPGFLKGRDYTGRPNVVGAFKGEGGGKSLILSGHVDTSPKEPMPWGAHGPFSGDVENGRIYGRGAFDMKGGLIAAFIAAKAIRECDIDLKGDLFVESVVDEEFGGANGTLACRLRGYEADAAINPECSSLLICPATRGDQNYKITVKGTPGMPYTGERTINPVYGIARIIQALRDFQAFRNMKERHPLYRDDLDPVPVLIKKLKAGEVERDGALGIPIDSWLLVGCQTYPGTSEKEIDEEFFKFMDAAVKSDPELAVNPPSYEKQFRYVWPSEIPKDHPIVVEVARSFEMATGRKGNVQGAPFPCDAFIFTMYSRTPVLVFGPGGANAHAPNEFVFIEDLIIVAKTLALTILKWCGEAS